MKYTIYWQLTIDCIFAVQVVAGVARAPGGPAPISVSAVMSHRWKCRNLSTLTILYLQGVHKCSFQFLFACLLIVKQVFWFQWTSCSASGRFLQSMKIFSEFGWCWVILRSFVTIINTWCCLKWKLQLTMLQSWGIHTKHIYTRSSLHLISNMSLHYQTNSKGLNVTFYASFELHNNWTQQLIVSK